MIYLPLTGTTRLRSEQRRTQAVGATAWALLLFAYHLFKMAQRSASVYRKIK